ncbi:hypothetical protein Mapa_005975 [Marchantia paleacea]|nr:hypothetical protein Mapa_005975 [Marchantia paleacea]
MLQVLTTPILQWKTLHRLGQASFKCFPRLSTYCWNWMPLLARCSRQRLNLSEDIERQTELGLSDDHGRQLSAVCCEDSRLRIRGVLGLCWSNCTLVHLLCDCASILGQISLREYEALHMPQQSSKVLIRLELGANYLPRIVGRCPGLEDVAEKP